MTNSESDVEFLEDDDEDPTEEQVLEYAEFLGMDLKTERHLLWIAREGVAAPVPPPWKTCTNKGEVFYFNLATEESSWDHPCDEQFRALLEEHRKLPGKPGQLEDTNDTEAQLTHSKAPVGNAEEENASHDESFVSELVESSEHDDANQGPEDAPSGPRMDQNKSEDSSPWSATSSRRSEEGNDSGNAATTSGCMKETEPSKTVEQEVAGDAVKEAKQAGIGLVTNGRISKQDAHEHGALSEVSEDFRSDWGAPSPLGSSAQGLLNPAPHSLEVSASDVGSVLALTSVKGWAALTEDLATLQRNLIAVRKFRTEQADRKSVV